MGRFDVLTQLDKKLDTPPLSEPEKPFSRNKQQGDSSSKLQQSEKEDQPIPPSQSQQEINPSHRDTVVSRNHDIKIPQTQDIVAPRYQDTAIPINEEGILEAVRKTVKQTGKEAATQRLTLGEKQALKTIEFTYGQQGIITSGNEIIRIATNYILQEYRKNGENSIVAKVLKRLNS